MNTVQKRPILPQLNVVRALAILGVLIVHATAQATIDMIKSPYYGVYQFFNIFFRHGTTTFIFLSSFVLFYTYYDRPLTKKLLATFYKKRLIYIVIPYFIASLFYFCIHSVAGLYKHESFIGGCHHFFSLLCSPQQAKYHLYFILITVQFYILFPFLLSLFQRYVRLAKWSVIIGVVLHVLFVFIHKYGYYIPYKSHFFVSYLAQFMLGAWLGIFFPKLNQWLGLGSVYKRANATQKMIWGCIALLWIGFGFILLNMMYNAAIYNIQYSSLWYDFIWNVRTLAAAFVLVYVSFRLYTKNNSSLTRALNSIGEHSFGIYLTHPFYQDIYVKFVPKSSSSMLIHVWYIGMFLFILLLPWLVVRKITSYSVAVQQHLKLGNQERNGGK